MKILRKYRLYVIWVTFHLIALILSYSGLSGGPDLDNFWPFEVGGCVKSYYFGSSPYERGFWDILETQGYFCTYDWVEFLFYVGSPILIMFLYKLFRPLNEEPKREIKTDIIEKTEEPKRENKTDIIEKTEEPKKENKTDINEKPVDDTLYKLQQTELISSVAPLIPISSWIKEIEHLYDGKSAIKLCSKGEWHEKFLNVPLLFKDQNDGQQYILIHCESPEIGKEIIDNIIESNQDSKNKFKRLDSTDEWWYMWKSKYFFIGILPKYRCIRINFTIREIKDVL